MTSIDEEDVISPEEDRAMLGTDVIATRPRKIFLQS